MAKAQAKTKKAYDADGVKAMLKGASVIEVAIVVQDADGNQTTLKSVNPNVKVRLAESGKSDNLWCGGAVDLPGVGKAQLGLNLTPWGSKAHNS